MNAAGIIRIEPIRTVDVSNWREIFAVNVEAVFCLCQALASRLHKGGAIVNVASMAAKTGEVEAAAYAASKAAVLSVTRSFAVLLAPTGVRVNSVSPGIIDTPMQGLIVPAFAQLHATSPEQFQAERLQSVPLGRAGSADEVASAIHFLLSDGASYITGEDVNVSGGLVYW